MPFSMKLLRIIRNKGAMLIHFNRAKNTMIKIEKKKSCKATQEFSNVVKITINFWIKIK